jgi:hypothetical protein
MSRSSAAAAEAKSLGVKRQKRKKKETETGGEKLIWNLPVLERRIDDSG